jgi:capsular exopolysaccharide synthesis family protein
MNTPDHSPDLREYIRVLRSRKYGVAAVTLLLVAATLAFSLRQTPIYEGEAKILVKPIQSPTPTASLPQAPNLVTERQLILSQAVAQTVASDLRITTSVDTLLKNVQVQVVTDSEILVVRYDDANPLTAAKLANGFASAYVAFRSHEALAQFQLAASAVQQQIDGIQERLSSLNQQIQKTSDPKARTTLESQRDTFVARLGVLQQRLLDLQSSGSAAEGSAQIVQRAEVPESPVSPNLIRNGILALLSGLALGIGFAFLRERLDDRVKSRDELERRLGAPVIAAVPKVGTWRKAEEPLLIMAADPKSPVSESYRTLGTNIQYLGSNQQLQILMITSAVGGEGKTTTAANLSVVLARAGRRVILVSADLRRSRVHTFFGLSNRVGLADILADSTQLADVLVDPGIDNLRIISGGPVPADPAALLAGQSAAWLLESLRELADFVILDAPPVLAVADASILAPLTDGTVFVTNAERSSRSAILHARDQLENAGARIIGAVYNNFDPSKSETYPYYLYYYQYDRPEGSSANGDRGKVLGRFGRRGIRSPAPQRVSAPQRVGPQLEHRGHLRQDPTEVDGTADKPAE